MVASWHFLCVSVNLVVRRNTIFLNLYAPCVWNGAVFIQMVRCNEIFSTKLLPLDPNPSTNFLRPTTNLRNYIQYYTIEAVRINSNCVNFCRRDGVKDLEAITMVSGKRVQDPKQTVNVRAFFSFLYLRYVCQSYA